MGLDTPGFEIDRSMWARIEAGLGFRGHLAMSKAEDVSAFWPIPLPKKTIRIWLRIGNTSHSALLQLFEPSFLQMVLLLENGEGPPDPPTVFPFGLHGSGSRIKPLNQRLKSPNSSKACGRRSCFRSSVTDSCRVCSLLAPRPGAF